MTRNAIPSNTKKGYDAFHIYPMAFQRKYSKSRGYWVIYPSPPESKIQLGRLRSRKKGRKRRNWVRNTQKQIQHCSNCTMYLLKIMRTYPHIKMRAWVVWMFNYPFIIISLTPQIEMNEEKRKKRMEEKKGSIFLSG